MGRKSWYLLIVGALAAYFMYTPLPDSIEEPWSVMWLQTQWSAMIHLATFLEILGINHFMDSSQFMARLSEVPPTSDENVTVSDTDFDNIPVRVYVPKRKSAALRRGLFYIHGGGWCAGSAELHNYDILSRWTADRLDAVVISTNYRLAPKYHFPIQFEDVYNALRWFLRKEVLAEYGVNPERVGVSGDSAGGNLAAAVTQQLLHDPDVKIKLKIQSLIYPALQALDVHLPSYQDNAGGPVLSKSLMIRFWSEYFTTDKALEKAMLLNQHVPEEASHLFKFVNWSSLLPERFQNGHVYKNPTYGTSELAKKYPGFLDVRAAPLLADDSKLRHLPRTYIITCQFDVLRDDGLMYVTRLRNAGVQAAFADLLGTGNLPSTFQFTASLEDVPPTSDEDITVTETTFNSIPVRVYLPRGTSETFQRGLWWWLLFGKCWCVPLAEKLYPTEKCNLSRKKHVIRFHFPT